MKTRIHSTAIVDPKAEIDSGVDIGPFCVIKGAVKIRKGNETLVSRYSRRFCRNR